YGKIMSISDEMMWRYYELLTDVQVPELEKMKHESHPMQAKKDLARIIVKDFHSGEAAEKAGEDWAKQFQKGAVPEEIDISEIQIDTIRAADVIPDNPVPETGGPAILCIGAHSPRNQVAIRVDKLIRQAGLATSNTEATAKIKSKAVSINGTNLSEKDFIIICSQHEITLRVGRKIKKIRLLRANTSGSN
ncbi:MAG: tyrosyl-tRNA synthetase, partial [Acidobacteriaceae bacterium]|nr:tyrosyl-tRNA synthetase [Acidobacteriaceae bacterium]